MAALRANSRIEPASRQRPARREQRSASARAGILPGVGLMLWLWLLLIGLASSEGLHRLVHADSHSPSHECLIKSFAQGAVLPPAAQAAALAVPSWCEPAGRAVSIDCSLVDLRLALSRAPPLASLQSLR